MRNILCSVPFVFLLIHSVQAQASEPAAFLLLGADEAVVIQGSGRLPDFPADCLDPLPLLGLQAGAKVQAWDNDGYLFQATIASGSIRRTAAGRRILLKTEIDNRQPDFDYLLVVPHAKPEGKAPKPRTSGKLYDVLPQIESSGDLLARLQVWWNVYMNDQVFDVKNYGTAYPYDFSAIPIPNTKRWLVSVRWTEKSGKSFSNTSVIELQPAALPKGGVKVVSKMDGVFIDTSHWFDADGNGRPDIRAAVSGTVEFAWVWLEYDGNSLIEKFKPALLP